MHNAIYRHGGRAFRVKDVIRGRKVVNLRVERTFNETTPFIQKKIQLRQTLQAADYQRNTAAFDLVGEPFVIKSCR